MLDNDTRPERRSALIAKELEKYQIDIAALQETRIEGEGQLQEKNYTFFWIGKTTGRRDAGVAFAINNKIASGLQKLPSGVSERIMSLRVPIGKERHASLICVYAPTMTYPVEEKEHFYQELTKVVDKVPTADKLIILGDFNARVGKDHTTYEGVIGKFGKGKKNQNGDLLLNFCTEHDLSITNTFFLQPDKNYYTWMHPRSKHFHLLDYVTVRKENLTDVLCTKAMRGAECSTDHYMLRTKLRMRIHVKRRKAPSEVPKRLDVSKLRKQEHQTTLASEITKALENEESVAENADINEQWRDLKETVYKTAKDVLGHPKRKSPDWFQESEAIIQELLTEKEKLHKIHLEENSERSKAKLTSAKAKVQREIRVIKDAWWNKKAEEMQEMADKNNSHGLFSELKTIYGPRTNTVAPVKTADGSKLCTDLQEITERWREHFCTLLNQEGAADPDACNQLDQRPVREDLCEPISMVELEEAIQNTRSGKAPGQDGIPSDILQHGGPKLKEQLLSLYNACWENSSVPQDFKDALIVTIYKRKGERNDCGNHRGISLLAIAGKILAKIVLNRLKLLSEEVLPESQCGFRAGRSTTDMIFTLRQLQEKAIEQQLPLYIVFVDFSKAFDTVDRKTLWKVLEIYGCPQKLIDIIKEFHEGMTGKVSISGDISEPFDVGHGVKQGCVLAPTLFTLYLTAVLEVMSSNLKDEGVYIRTRSDGKLFNLARLRATTKTTELCVRELLYADDSALVANDLEEMQQIVNCFAKTATLFGLKINVTKTELLYQPPLQTGNEETQPRVFVNREALKTTSCFTYLGSALTDTNSSDAEVDRRIQAASKAFGALIKRLWTRHDIKLATKVKVYNAAVLPALLYGTECMTLYRQHLRKLTRIQLRHLRQLLGIKWQDRVPDVEVLKRANTVSAEAVITASQLRWAGHVTRMPDSRLPKAVFYGELREGNRKRGGQKLRYKDVLKRHMKNCSIDVNTWEQVANDRTKWRATVRRSKAAVEQKRRDTYETSHNTRHNIPTQTNFQCTRCDRHCRTKAGLRAHERYCTT